MYSVTSPGDNGRYSDALCTVTSGTLRSQLVMVVGVQVFCVL
jgi:hypothetical protein